MRKKRNGLYPVAAALVILGLAGCGTQDAMQNEIELLTPVEAVVDIETVMYRDLYTMTTRDAELAPYTDELSFEASGKISKLYVELGSEVKAGDLLAEQEEEGVVNAANEALNKYLSEKKVYMNTVKAAKKKLAAKPGKDEREWQELLIVQAEELWEMQEPQLWAAWEDARSKLGKSQIFASCDGVITSCLSEGDTVSAGQPVMALADTNRLYVTVGSYLSPADYSNYEEVYAIVNGKDTEVTYIEELMEEEGLYTYYSAEDYSGAKMGDYVLVCMTSNYHDHVLSIPAKAIYRDSSGSYVYLLDGDIRVRRDVVTGYSSDVYVEILEGLQEGDRVYVKN